MITLGYFGWRWWKASILRLMICRLFNYLVKRGVVHFSVMNWILSLWIVLFAILCSIIIFLFIWSLRLLFLRYYMDILILGILRSLFKSLKPLVRLFGVIGFRDWRLLLLFIIWLLTHVLIINTEIFFVFISVVLLVDDVSIFQASIAFLLSNLLWKPIFLTLNWIV